MLEVFKKPRNVVRISRERSHMLWKGLQEPYPAATTQLLTFNFTYCLRFSSQTSFYLQPIFYSSLIIKQTETCFLHAFTSDGRATWNRVRLSSQTDHMRWSGRCKDPSIFIRAYSQVLSTIVYSLENFESMPPEQQLLLIGSQHSVLFELLVRRTRRFFL